MSSICVTDRMQQGYVYELSEPSGKNFDPKFEPDLTPAQMLALGVFGGVYLRDCQNEFPCSWFGNAKLAEGSESEPELNYFRVAASLPLSHWREKGWLSKEDPRGWFQWYCRYYQGRRLQGEDRRQITRWYAMRRHVGAITKNCECADEDCRRKQRQALLHWAYDSRQL